jgi:hypothetical protein
VIVTDDGRQFNIDKAEAENVVDAFVAWTSTLPRSGKERAAEDKLLETADQYLEDLGIEDTFTSKVTRQEEPQQTVPTKQPYLARLSPQEDRTWSTLFSDLVNDGHSDEEADKAAWEELQRQYPRLKSYDGIKPDGDFYTPSDELRPGTGEEADDNF